MELAQKLGVYAVYNNPTVATCFWLGWCANCFRNTAGDQPDVQRKGSRCRRYSGMVVFKYCSSHLLPHLVELVELIWTEASVPQDFKNAQIVHIYKRKGNRACCDNHRSLLSVAGKILARVLLNRLSKHVGRNNIIRESQCGFRAARGTTYMIFAARQIQEKCREQYQDLCICMVFIDLTKAFDTVNRQGLWQVLRKIGCPEKFIQVVQSFRDGMQGQAIDGCEASPLFDVTNGIKQGCVLAPLLFCIFFSVMLLVAFKDCDKGQQRNACRAAYRPIGGPAAQAVWLGPSKSRRPPGAVSVFIART